MNVKAGVVVVTKFCKSSSKAFSSYIDYVDREEAARSNNTSKYNLYQDYMGNPEKSTGLFTETGDVQTMEEKTKLKDIFKQAQSKDSLMWQTVSHLIISGWRKTDYILQKTRCWMKKG